MRTSVWDSPRPNRQELPVVDVAASRLHFDEVTVSGFRALQLFDSDVRARIRPQGYVTVELVSWSGAGYVIQLHPDTLRRGRVEGTVVGVMGLRCIPPSYRIYLARVTLVKNRNGTTSVQPCRP